MGRFIALYGHGYGLSLLQVSIRSMLGISSGIVSQMRVLNHDYESRARDIYESTNAVLFCTVLWT